MAKELIFIIVILVAVCLFVLQQYIQPVIEIEITRGPADTREVHFADVRNERLYNVSTGSIIEDRVGRT
jgi:hypothetical protein